MTNKNMTKYESYKFAFEQIDLAIESEFYLEAITIEESIISDRLISYLQLNGKTGDFSRIGLYQIVKKVGNVPGQYSIKVSENFLLTVDDWRNKRNTCIHQLVKSDKGEPTIDVEKFKNIAKETAKEGRILARQISSWTTSQKRKRERQSNAK